MSVSEAPGRSRPLWLRLAPLALILAALGAAWTLGAFDYFSLDALKENRAALTAFVAERYLAALAIFFCVYALATVLAIPGALWITLTGGFLFGLAVGAATVTLAATTGAVILFLIARSAAGEGLARRAGPWLKRMEEGFKRDEAFYLLALRLAPVIPYPVANIAPALLGARLSTFAWTTFVGIIPGVTAYTWIGAGLGGVLDAGREPDIATLSRQILPALLALGALPLIAIAARRFAKKKP